jgi:creatinine amidohydrolase/Fe(II)-dependent formamide hydrolase-like protein
MDILRRKEEAEAIARKKAEKERFYLTTAANLVISAEKLSLTGPQKKDYVMTWLENEAIRSGVDIDRALMSVAIERTILIMNDHRGKDVAVADLLKEELDKIMIKLNVGIQINEIRITGVQPPPSINKSFDESTINNIKNTLLDKFNDFKLTNLSTFFISLI